MWVSAPQISLLIPLKPANHEISTVSDGGAALPSNTLHSKLHSPRSKRKYSEAHDYAVAPLPARKRSNRSASRKPLPLPPLSIATCDESVSTMSSGTGGGDKVSGNGPPARKRGKRVKKNEAAKQRNQSRREVAIEIEQKPESERTANEREWLASFLEQRDKKNAQSRERAIAKAAEFARIEGMDPSERTPEESQWYALQCQAKRAKNEADRERRAQKKAQMYPDGVPEPPKRIEYEFLQKVKAEAYKDPELDEQMEDGGKVSPIRILKKHAL